MAQLAYSRHGSGPPLVLIHALGSSRAVWEPVMVELTGRFDVVAVDLPGFGGSAPLPPGVEPHPARLALAVAELLDVLGLGRPHVVGNSLGGWVALELARLRPVSSLTLLAPAGLWRRGTPLYCLASLRITRWASRHAAGVLSRFVGHRWGRVAVLGQTHGRPTRMSPERARAAITALGTAPGFDAALAATVHRRYAAGPALGAPVTVAFGTRDLTLLPGQSRHVDQLPAGTRTVRLPGCGHIPMSDAPEAVVAVIVSTAATVPVRTEVPPGPAVRPGVLPS